MNKIKKVYYTLMFIPLFVTCISLMFLPEQIPAHFNLNEVTRWESKFESLILPLLAIMFGFFLMEVGKIASKKESEENNNNERVAMLSGLGALFVFNILTLFFLYVDLNSVGNLNHLTIDLYSMLFAITGITLIITGNYMPKCKRNSLIGLRTTWSMKNEITWAKSQKFSIPLHTVK